MKDAIHDLAIKNAEDIAARKEEILEAFVAKYGYQPDEMILCEQPSIGKFWVEKKEHQDYKAKYEEVKEMLLSVLRELDSRKSFDYAPSIQYLDCNIQEFWEQQKEKKDEI